MGTPTDNDSQNSTGNFDNDRVGLQFVALCVLVVLVFGPAISHDFLTYDDPGYVTQNEDIAEGISLASIQAAFTTSYVSSWHPLSTLSHAADVELFGYDPVGHHAVSILWHALNSCLLLVVTRRLLGNAIVGFAVAAIFAVHPQHVEPVAWIASRKDLVSTFFLLLTVLFYVGYVTKQSTSHYLAALTSLILGLLAKPMLITLPFALMLLDVWPLERIKSVSDIVPKAVEKLPMFGVCVGIAIVTFLVQDQGGAVRTTDEYSASARASNAVYAYGQYAIQTIAPLRLSGLYPHTNETVTTINLAMTVSGLAMLTVAAIVQLKRRKYLFVGWFWFLGTLFPVIGIVSFGAHGMADRYLYVAHLGVFWALLYGVWVALPENNRRHVFVVISSVVVVLYASLSAHYLRTWRNTETVFTNAIAVHPDNVMALIVLGEFYLDNGELHRAESHFARAVDIAPDSHLARRGLGLTYVKRGQLEQALPHFARAVGSPYQPVGSRQRLAALHQSLGNLEDAERWYNAALEQKSDEREARINAFEGLIGLRRNLGKIRESESTLKDALAEFGEVPDLALESAIVAERAGDVVRAERLYRSAVEFDPSSPTPWSRLGRLLAESSRLVDARVCFVEAARLAPDTAIHQQNLALIEEILENSR